MTVTEAATPLTFEQVRAEFEVLANERPLYVYKREVPLLDRNCFYFETPHVCGLTAPGCIVGHWMARFHRDWVKHLNFNGTLNGAGALSLFQAARGAGLANFFSLVDYQKSQDFILRLQSQQDSGEQWGAAYKQAVAWVEEYTYG